MDFYLGTHDPNWLGDATCPLFVSHRRLAVRYRRGLPVAAHRWALDSGAFSEVAQMGRFTTTPADYVAAVARYADEIGRLDWAAPQDHMCEPWVLARSELARTVDAAQAWTVVNLLELRHRAAHLPIIPVLQGQTVDDYLRHADAYAAAGVNLTAEPLVGLGSVCRRSHTGAVAQIVAALPGLRLHGFGVKTSGLADYGWCLTSADSLAWSYNGRRIRPCPRRGLASCANCRHHADAWRRRVLDVVAGPSRPIVLQLGL